jgi:C4-dicarboxylate-specific signal transduction histidine kinase
VRNGCGGVVITFRDPGSGFANPGDLFVPFFTTKPKGSGIGLTLAGRSRKITVVP